jgi:sugar O-acyltransferase (sialic acid O-acetyltransferase NeuD family)
MSKLLIIGAGGHAQVIADLVKCQSQAGTDISIVGFLDDDVRRFESINVFGKVLTTVNRVKEIPHDRVLIGIGDNKIRQAIFLHLQELGEPFLTLVHPKAVVASDVHIGIGSVVVAGVVINTGAVVGDNVIINTGATVDHHNIIESHVHIGPGSHLGGGVLVGEGSFLGIGASVLPDRKIGKWSIIGAGSVVTHDIPSYVTAFGVPAKIRDTHPVTADYLAGS